MLVGSPFREFHFTNECRFNPLYRLIRVRLDGKRGVAGLETLHEAINLLKAPAVETTPHMPQIVEF